MPLHKPAAEVSGYIQPAALSERTARRKQVYGINGSFQVATRPPGYHTKPHVHDCEQLNYMLEGDMWLFVEGKGYHLREGDFLRIPANAIHWAWCPSEKDSTLFEWHSPSLLSTRPDAKHIPLFDDDELIRTVGTPGNMPANLYLDPDVYPAERAERIVTTRKQKKSK